MIRPTSLEEILDRLQQTQRELEHELDRMLEEKRQQFKYQLRRGKVVFAQGIRRWQKEYRTGLWSYVSRAPVIFILSAPVIYAMIIPLVLLDISLFIYQHICFRIYGIPLVKRADYVVIDRHLLNYLNLIEKINCVYCGYGNGLIEYAREITARTEQYWCPIKHARRTPDAHRRTQRFLDYGDAEAYTTRRQELREDWSDPGQGIK